MKKQIILFGVLCFSMLAQSFAQSITIKGSDTLLPFSQREAEAYMQKHKSARITVTGGGSGVGISAFLDGTTDIAMASRAMELSERLKLKRAKKDFKTVVVALDALAVIVNPSNPVHKLTRAQMEGIFTGKITNWKQVGGKNLPIVIYSRETSSGTYEHFKKVVLLKKNYAAKALLMPSTGAIVQSVSQTQGAIGYIGFSYLNSKVKAIDVSFDGKNFIEPTAINAKDKKYPITRQLYYYYMTNNESNVKPFINFVLSPAGQKLASHDGYIPIK